MNSADCRTFAGDGFSQGAAARGLSRRSFLKGAALVGFSFTALGQLVGCGASSSSSDDVPESLTFLFNDAPTSFEPTTAWDGWYTVCRGITETLVVFDAEMNLAPCLATSWEQESDLIWRFTLRNDVKFHTGSAMTAQAVADSLERTVAKSTRAATKINLDFVEVDGNDLVIHTTEPVYTLPGELAEPVFSIVDVATADDSPATSGTGPYMGKELTSPETFTLERFEEYWGGTPKVAELQFQTTTDPSARALALQSGDADAAWSIQASDLDTFRNDDAFQLQEVESVRMVFAFCNFANAHLATHEVRQALSYGFDRASVCEQLLSGSVQANGLMFPSYLSYSEAVADAEQSYDAEKAAQLLADAGYVQGSNGTLEKDGSPLSLTVAYYESRPELPIVAQAMQDQWGQLGVEVTLKLYENIDELFGTDEFDVMLYNTTTIGNGDPTYLLNMYYLSTGSENAGRYANSEVDALIAKMNSESDQETRFDLAAQVQRLVLADCPNLFIGSPVMNLAARKDVQGLELYPVEYYGVTGEVA